jgi:RND family efflux transporter, MFP subunit
MNRCSNALTIRLFRASPATRWLASDTTGLPHAPELLFLLFAGIRIHKPKPGDANENTEFHLPATVRPRTPCHPDGLGGYGIGRVHKEKEPPPVVRPVRSVVVEKRQVGDPKVVSGHLRARNEVNLAFRIAGRIIERKVGVGDKVEAGQTVALLDAEVERNARNSAQADVAAARASLDQSEAFERRQKKLLPRRVISPNEYDTALRQLKTTKAQLDAAQAKLKSAEEQLSYTELKSDAAGVITEKGPRWVRSCRRARWSCRWRSKPGAMPFSTSPPRPFATACR